MGFSMSSKTFLTLCLSSSFSIIFLASSTLRALVKRITSSKFGLVMFESMTQRAKHNSLSSYDGGRGKFESRRSPALLGKAREFFSPAEVNNPFTLSPIVLNSSFLKKFINLSTSKFSFHSLGKIKWIGASVRMVAKVLEKRASFSFSSSRVFIRSLNLTFSKFL